MESRLIFDDDLDEASHDLDKAVRDAISSNMNKEFQEAVNCHNNEEEFWKVPGDVRLYVLLILLLCFASKEDILTMLEREVSKEYPELARQIREMLTKEPNNEQTNQKEES